jgi:streptogramin lyase
LILNWKSNAPKFEVFMEDTLAKKWIFLQSIFAILIVASCAKQQGDFLHFANLPSKVLVISAQNANHAVVVYYDLDGEFLGYMTDLRGEGSVPRGLAPFPGNRVVISAETVDAIHLATLAGKRSLFYGSALFTGNIFDIEYGGNDHIYAIETNNIEVFDKEGVRVASKVIPATVGGCTLSTPRNMAIDSNGYLVVSNQGGVDAILRYDISGLTATCVSSVAFGNNPAGVLPHSDGNLYVATQGNDQIYQTDPDGANPVAIFTTDLTLISDPNAMVELPGGDILVASSLTNTIERIDTNGDRVGSVPFIRDAFSLNVFDMIILETEE